MADNLLADIELSSAQTSTATFALMTGMTADVTVEGVDSIIILIANVPIETDGADSCVELRFTQDGSPVGGSVASYHDGPPGEGDGLMGYTFMLTGLSAGSHTFTLQWRTFETGVARPIDTTQTRNFQILELTAGAAAPPAPIPLVTKGYMERP